jgi:transposase
MKRTVEKMTINGNTFVIKNLVHSVRAELKKTPGIPPALLSSMHLLTEALLILSNQKGLNSQNSSIPPSKDPNRVKRKGLKKGKKKPGGQIGHKGSRLEPFANPTQIEEYEIDRRTLPKGEYESAGFEARQVIDITASLVVTEYRCEILVDRRGNQYVAEFPNGVTEPVQYGSSVKATSVYLSEYQLIPLDRVTETLESQFGLALSKGSVSNFNIYAYKALEGFEVWLKERLKNVSMLHADETGVNVNGKGCWLHNLSNLEFTYFFPDEKRGQEAMDRMGVLPFFKGILTHDHWKAYFNYDCVHSLCNAHHLRELVRAFEQDGQLWAKNMRRLLLKINVAVDKAGGVLSPKADKEFRIKYRQLLARAEKECPRNEKTRKQSPSRNLLQRLTAFEEQTLLFMEDELAPFTNNQGERDIRMTKVHQKISGCFRSMEGARIFCRIRSYLSTCRKQGVEPMEALRLLFNGKLPEFVK